LPTPGLPISTRLVFQEGEIEQTKDAVLGLHAAFVVVEVEGVNAGLRLQAST
jgi:hypothetical protein